MKNEYYNLYIEADEEVTTIISRLHLARAICVALIIPQHSLVLQSIINLRLLAREAKKLHKEILIVTQDEEGMVFASRVGIETIPLHEWQEQTVQNREQVRNGEEYAEAPVEHMREPVPMRPPLQPRAQEPRRTPRDAMDAGLTSHQHRERTLQSAISTERHREEEIAVSYTPQAAQDDHHYTREESRRHTRDNLEELYSGDVTELVEESPKALKKKSKKRKKKQSRKISGGLAHKAHHFGWFLAFASISCVLAFILLPLSFVTVRLGSASLSEQVSITAKKGVSEIDVERRVIPIREIEKEITRTIKIPTTGKGDVKPQKASGKIVISNAFSGQSQQLVATTRFESPEGIIFRLVKGVSVPGMTVKGDEIVPGTIEADVVADKSGAVGNIGATTWTIPGFASTAQKFAKFAGTSATSMSGGSAGGTDVGIVEEADIATAKTAAQKGIDEFYVSQLKDLVRDSETLLPEAISSEIATSEATLSAGAAASELEHVVRAKVIAYVFEEADVDQLALDVARESNAGTNPDSMEKNISFKDISVDFGDGKLSMKAVVAIEGEAEIDEGVFVGSIRGRSHDEIQDILREQYPYVRDIGIKTYPPFPQTIGNKFSRYGWMTRITVERE